jgi:NADPH:quinone reductase-like Zn-dependent oxidoreductase
VTAVSGFIVTQGVGMFRALVIDSNGGTVSTSLQNVSEASLPSGNVVVAVEYSTVNYKDGLVVTGAGGLVKRYPHVPGVDFAGRVLDSHHLSYKPGDGVVLTGWRVGEVQWGGMAQKASVDGDWLVPARCWSRVQRAASARPRSPFSPNEAIRWWHRPAAPTPTTI